MTDHTHEWALELEEAHGGQFYCAAHCAICNLEMPIDETNRRLNATDRLNAKSPIGVGVDEQGGWGEYVAIKREDWTAYIAALEGE